MFRKRRFESNMQNKVRIAIEFAYPDCQTLTSYVAELNALIEQESFKVNLQLQDHDPSFNYIIQNLFIANQQKAPIPSRVVEGLQYKTVNPEEIIERAIQTVLRSLEQRADSQHQNVLIMGFTELRPGGKGSVFRSLDSRGPSSIAQVLLSPPWRKLFACLGHVLMYHILSQTTLLLSLKPPMKRRRGRKNDENKPSSHVLDFAVLQLTGELPKTERSHATASAQNIMLIQYKKSILNRTARNKYVPIEELSGADFTSHESPESECSLAAKLSRSVLYTKSQLNDGLPSMHSLQRLRNNTTSAINLFYQIFAGKQRLSLHVRSSKNFKPKKRLIPLVPVLHKFINRMRFISFRDILGVHCPLPNWFRSCHKSSCKRVEVVAKDFTKPRHVARFLTACVRKTFPQEMFGSNANMIVLQKGVHEFIRKRTRNEAFSVSDLVLNQGFKISEVPWLNRAGLDGRRVCNPTDLSFRKRMLLVFVSWLFEEFLIPILLKSFYVTDSQVFGTRLLYYRREVWIKFLDGIIKRALHKDHRMFSAISTNELALGLLRRDRSLRNLDIRIKPGQFLTCFQLRFVPKIKGARPVQRLMSKQWGNVKQLHQSKSLNSSAITDTDELRRSLEQARGGVKSFLSLSKKILRMCCQKRKDLLGSSVFCLDEIYIELLHFKEKWSSSGRKRIFALSFDISKSFDTVPLNVLATKILPEVLYQTRYVVLRFVVVTRNPTTGKTLRRFERHVCEEPGEETAFQDIITKKLYKKYRHAVFIDLVRVQIIHREVLLSAMQEFVMNNVVVLPRHSRRSIGTPYARQVQGLAQGNPLSPILTCLFYGFLEKRYLSRFLVDDSVDRSSTVFLRLIDDTFFASTEQEKTSSFANAMIRDWHDTFGLSVNGSKTKANYPAGVGGKECLRMIPWCGLLLDTKLMEVRSDFSKYEPSKLSSLRQILSIDFDLSPGRGLEKKTLSCFQPKIHPILLDPKINSSRTIALNVYQAALLMALKLCSCALTVQIQNSNYMHKVINNTAFRFCELMQRTSSSQGSQKFKQLFSNEQVMFLAQTALLWSIEQRFSLHRAGRAIANSIEPRMKDNVQFLFEKLSSTTPDLAQMLKAVTLCKSNKVLWAIRL